MNGEHPNTREAPTTEPVSNAEELRRLASMEAFSLSYARSAMSSAAAELDRLGSELHRRIAEFDIEREATRREMKRIRTDLRAAKGTIHALTISGQNDLKEIKRLSAVFEEACNEVRVSHDTPCFCKYCHEPKVTS